MAAAGVAAILGASMKAAWEGKPSSVARQPQRRQLLKDRPVRGRAPRRAAHGRFVSIQFIR